MTKGRLEAFSDGVIAIIITIMVLELKAPESSDPHSLLNLIPVFFSYILSFIYVGIYWNNHHHLLQATRSVNGKVLLANLHLLFWLSLIPFVTAWLGRAGVTPVPVALYGIVMIFAGIAYLILSRLLISHHGNGSELALAVGCDKKGFGSIMLYLIALPLAFSLPWLACLIYVFVALIWLVPDSRIETALKNGASKG